MHHPGCSYLLQRENSPQRPGEKIRAEPNNFTAVYLTITDTSPPPDPSPSPHSLCLCVFLNPPTLQSSAGLALTAKQSCFLIPTGRARRGCAPCAWVYSGWEMGRRRRTVRHLTGVCNPLAPSGAAESAPYPGTGGLRARCTSAISWLFRWTDAYKIDFLLLRFDWLRCASAVS